MTQNARALVLVIGSTLLIGVILSVLLFAFDLQAHVRNLLIWIDGHGIWGPVIFIAIDVVVVMTLFPGVLVTMGAGFLFGVVQGSIYVIIATTIGAICAFLLARHFLSEQSIAKFQSYPRLRAVDHILAEEGWRIVLLTRLIPFFPFKLSNYLYGLTKFSLRDFSVGTFFGVWPFTIFNVYVGSIIADLSMLGTPAARSKTQWILYIVGFTLAIMAVIYISHRARLALKELSPSHHSDSYGN